jgi:hypothetical protein
MGCGEGRERDEYGPEPGGAAQATGGFVGEQGAEAVPEQSEGPCVGGVVGERGEGGGERAGVGR